MGQYYKLVETERREFLSPSRLDSGIKMGAATWASGVALAFLLSHRPGNGMADVAGFSLTGVWAGGRPLVIGDYAETNDIPTWRGPDLSTLYNLACERRLPSVEIAWSVGCHLDNMLVTAMREDLEKAGVRFDYAGQIQGRYLGDIIKDGGHGHPAVDRVVRRYAKHFRTLHARMQALKAADVPATAEDFKILSGIGKIAGKFSSIEDQVERLTADAGSFLDETVREALSPEPGLSDLIHKVTATRATSWVTLAALACRYCARPISDPSGQTIELFDMFWAL